jgi:hypothetical protein
MRLGDPVGHRLRAAVAVIVLILGILTAAMIIRGYGGQANHCTAENRSQTICVTGGTR